MKEKIVFSSLVHCSLFLYAVLKATLVRMEDFGGEIKLRMRIMNVTKEGEASFFCCVVVKRQ